MMQIIWSSCTLIASFGRIWNENTGGSQEDAFFLKMTLTYVGIMIHMLYLMATHSSQMINYSAKNFTEFYAEKGLFHVEKSSRNFMQRKVYFMKKKVHGILCRENFISCGEKFTEFYAEKGLFHVEKSLFHEEKSSRNFMQRKFYFMWRKVHRILCRERFISCGEKFTEFYAEKSLFHVEKSSRIFMVGSWY